MIEWIVFFGLALIISEIFFYKFGDSDGWLVQKILSLFIGGFLSFIIFGIPCLLAYGCNYQWFISSFDDPSECVGLGINAFFWYYGLIFIIVLFFWLNRKLIIKKEQKKYKINKKDETKKLIGARIK